MVPSLATDIEANEKAEKVKTPSAKGGRFAERLERCGVDGPADRAVLGVDERIRGDHMRKHSEA